MDDVPTPNPMTKSVTVSSDTSILTWNVLAGPSRLAVMTALLKATEKQVSATIIVHHHLYFFDQFFGLSDSN